LSNLDKFRGDNIAGSSAAKISLNTVLYPNPAKESLNVRNNEAYKLYLNLKDLNGRTVRSAEVNAYGDAILKSIHPELAKRALVEKALQWQNRRMMGGDDFLLQTWNDAKMQLMQAKLDYPIWKPKRESRILTIGPYVERDEFKMPWE